MSFQNVGDTITLELLFVIRAGFKQKKSGWIINNPVCSRLTSLGQNLLFSVQNKKSSDEMYHPNSKHSKTPENSKAKFYIIVSM